MKKIVVIGLLLSMSACVHTKVERTGRMNREIMVQPIIEGGVSEAYLVESVIAAARWRNCYSVKMVEWSEKGAIGNCYDIVH